MKHILLKSIAGAGFLVFSLGAMLRIAIITTATPTRTIAREMRASTIDIGADESFDDVRDDVQHIQAYHLA